MTLREWASKVAVALLCIFLLVQWARVKAESEALARDLKVAQEAHQAALQQAALGQAALDRAKALEDSLVASEALRRSLIARVDQLQAQVDAVVIPPAPGLAPSEPSQVLADLRQMGTRPEALSDTRVAFPPSDAPTLWTWGHQALRVPALEAKVAAQDELALGLRAAMSTTTQQLRLTEQQRDEFKVSIGHFQDAFKTEQQRGDVLTLQIGTLTTQRDRARRTRIYLGVAALAGGFYLGKRF